MSLCCYFVFAAVLLVQMLVSCDSVRFLPFYPLFSTFYITFFSPDQNLKSRLVTLLRHSYTESFVYEFGFINLQQCCFNELEDEQIHLHKLTTTCFYEVKDELILLR